MKRTGLVAVILGLTFLFTAGTAAASPQDVANRISERVMSPFCPGVTLHDCPSDNALQLRAQIARWASQGWSTGRIMNKLLAEYGPDIRAVPPNRGASVLVWILPGLAVLLGGATAFLLAKRWIKGQEVPRAPRSLVPEERHRLEEELAMVRGEP